jgi:hypothetical protein
MSLYLVAFGFLLAAGIVLLVSARSFLESIPLLWVSILLSAGAIVTAALGVFLPKKEG